jgi:poly-gamma-glutamate capsule biosynthesis protein CapA/YwtB (metallophosphatase superfamily)
MDLLLVGDVMLGRLVNQKLEYEAPECPWGDTLSLFSMADVRICNLECVISDHSRPWSATPKVFHFRSDRKNVAVLKRASIDAVSLANNHTLDYEYEAMLDMLATLDREGIVHAGAGHNIFEASAPALISCSGLKMGLVAFTDNEPGWEATDTRPGIFHVQVGVEESREERLFTAMEQARSVVDLLVISAHWGPNWGYRPPGAHIPFARRLVDAGADVVFGHSGHLFRGIEVYKERPILYCAGDFVDDYAVQEVERNDESFVFVVQTEGHRVIRVRAFPTIIRDFQARRAQGRQAETIAGKMALLSQQLGTESTWNAGSECLELRVGAWLAG